MKVKTQHAVLTMWLIVNQVELESLKHTSTCCAFETIDVPDGVVSFKSITDNRQTTSSTDRALNSMVMQLAIHITVEFVVHTIIEGHFAAGTAEASLMPVPGTIFVVEIDALSNRLVAACTDHS